MKGGDMRFVYRNLILQDNSEDGKSKLRNLEKLIRNGWEITDIMNVVHKENTICIFLEKHVKSKKSKNTVERRVLVVRRRGNTSSHSEQRS